MPPVDPRAQPRQARSRFTVGVILEATERLVSRAEKLSTRGIARLAGVSVGTLYQYFPAKEAALAAVIDRRIADDEARLLAVFEAMRQQSLADALRSAIEGFVPSTEWERALYPELVDTLESLDRLAAVKGVLSRFERLLGEELSRRREELAADLDPKVAATVILHANRAAFFALARSHQALPREQMIDHLTRLCLRYLLPQPADPPLP